MEIQKETSILIKISAEEMKSLYDFLTRHHLPSDPLEAHIKELIAILYAPRFGL